MMTKEIIAEIVVCREENKVSNKQRHAEQEMNPWIFYDTKCEYAPR